MKPEIKKMWEMYLDAANAGNIEESYNHLLGEDGGWRKYSDGVKAISEFLIATSRNHEEISLDIVPPILILALATGGVQIEKVASNDDGEWRDDLRSLKSRFEQRSNQTYPAANGRNDALMNIGSRALKTNTFRGSNGQSYE